VAVLTRAIVVDTVPVGGRLPPLKADPSPVDHPAVDRRQLLRWNDSVLLRAWRGTVFAGFTFFVLHLAIGLGGPGLDPLVDQWLADALEVLAGVCCLARAVSTRAERPAWGVLGAGLLLYATGDICFDFVYGGNPPVPSVADGFYLGFYPACYAAVLLLVRSRISSFTRSVLLDGLAAALAAGALCGAVVLELVLQHTSGSTPTVLVDLAYPAADVLLLGLVVFVFAVTGWRPGKAWAYAGTAFALFAVADGLFLSLSAGGGYAEGTPLDALWPAAMLLLAVAAWQPVGREHSIELEGRFLPATPVVCGFVGLAVLLSSRVSPHNVLADVLAALAIVTVFIRTGLTFRESKGFLEIARGQSLTDPLTGLGNRRALMTALDRELLTGEAPVLLAIFDLNGFKRYNDTFGHPSGDALLVRLAGKLEAALQPAGQAFRLGGDEFCILLPLPEEGTAQLLERAIESLTAEGDGFRVSTEFGAVVLHEEAEDAGSAMRLADERLYAQKARRHQGEESYEVLMQALSEREPGLREHMRGVAELSAALGTRLGIAGHALRQLQLAAELHDVGKLAIPDAVLQKPGELDEQEWAFIRRHTLIGQRILAGVPAMREVGTIVRATHERWDGTGYADGLAQTAIPLEARIIAVCDAYSAMTSDRPYRRAVGPAEALAELRRCAGSQFDPEVVKVACAILEEAPEPRPASTGSLAVGA